jgi:hypothetical protein
VLVLFEQPGPAFAIPAADLDRLSGSIGVAPGRAGRGFGLCEQWTDYEGVPEKLRRRDEMLDDMTVYWLTATAASSAPIYWRSMRSFKEHSIEVLVGVSLFRHPSRRPTKYAPASGTHAREGLAHGVSRTG